MNLEQITAGLDERDVEIRIRNLARQELIDTVKSRILDLERLHRHQLQSGHDSSETHGELKAYGRVLSWLESFVQAVPDAPVEAADQRI